MNLTELYSQTPVERHREVVISSDRLYFDNEEYVIAGGEELIQVKSQKVLEQKLARIEAKLGIGK